MIDKIVELEVYGLVVGPYQPRPLLLMKEKKGSSVLPITLTPLEAQILAFGSDRSDGPHGPHFTLLKKKGLSLSKALFTEVRGHRQILNIHFASKGKSADTVIECSAESSMSLCIGAKAPVYASLDFIEQCRQGPFEIAIDEKGDFQGDKIPPHLLQ